MLKNDQFLFFLDMGANKVYIGGQRLDDDTWMWVVAGEAFGWTNWDYNENNDPASEKCLCQEGNKKWHDVNCAEIHPFVCEYYFD